jgi:hypothetical protein
LPGGRFGEKREINMCRLDNAETLFIATDVSTQPVRAQDGCNNSKCTLKGKVEENL